MKWIVEAKFKAEVLTKFIVSGDSIDEVVTMVKEDAHADALENFEIIDVSPFIEVGTEDKRIVN